MARCVGSYVVGYKAERPWEQRLDLLFCRNGCTRECDPKCLVCYAFGKKWLDWTANASIHPAGSHAGRDVVHVVLIDLRSGEMIGLELSDSQIVGAR